MFLLFDIGGTKTRVAVVGKNESLDKNKTKIFPTPSSFTEGIEKITETGKELSRGKKIELAAGGIGGPLNKEKSLLANHVRKEAFVDWENKPLKGVLAEKLACEVFLENDSALGALGEATFGAGKEFDIVAYITLGTGIGGARIVNKEIDENSLGFEPGKQIIDVDGSIFPDMKPPIKLEQVLGGQAIEKRMGKIATEIDDAEFWNKMTEYLAMGLNDTIVHWSPDVVILDGSVSEDISIEKLKRKLAEILTTFPTLPKIEKATLGELPGLYGALQYLKSKNTT